jgi:hypothetical protein
VTGHSPLVGIAPWDAVNRGGVFTDGKITYNLPGAAHRHRRCGVLGRATSTSVKQSPAPLAIIFKVIVGQLGRRTRRPRVRRNAPPEQSS